MNSIFIGRPFLVYSPVTSNQITQSKNLINLCKIKVTLSCIGTCSLNLTMHRIYASCNNKQFTSSKKSTRFSLIGLGP